MVIRIRHDQIPSLTSLELYENWFNFILDRVLSRQLDAFCTTNFEPGQAILSFPMAPNLRYALACIAHSDTETSDSGLSREPYHALSSLESLAVHFVSTGVEEEVQSLKEFLWALSEAVLSKKYRLKRLAISTMDHQHDESQTKWEDVVLQIQGVCTTVGTEFEAEKNSVVRWINDHLNRPFDLIR